MKEKTMVLIISFSFGLIWSVIYLVFSLMHRMTEMFNENFIFLIANIFNIKITSTFSGFVYSFIDGALIGGGLVVLFLKLKKRFIDER
ncbi:MAG: hypothetical protein IPM14_15355 [bacterium]|nr:hypothetical protein [bacterium]